MKHKSIIFMSLLLFTLQASATSAMPAELKAWNMFQANPMHTGFVDVTLNHKDFKYAWKNYVGDAPSPGLNFAISQAMANGALVYVSRNNYAYSNTLQAFSILSGKQIWKKSFGGAESSPPTLVGNQVFMEALNYGTSEGSGLYKYNGISGSGEMVQPFGSVWHEYISGSYYKGILYMDHIGTLYAYDVANNKMIWQNYPYAQYVLWSPAVDNQYVAIYVDGNMQIYDRLSGQLLETINNPNYFFGSQSNVVNVAPVLLSNGNIVTIQGQQGALTIYNIAAKKITATIGSGYRGMPAVDNNYIYAADNGELMVLHRGNVPTEAWTWSPPSYEQVNGQFIVTKNLIFVSTFSHVYAIDKKTHKSVWSYPAGGKITLGMGHLFIMQQSGVLIAITVVPMTDNTQPVS